MPLDFIVGDTVDVDTGAGIVRGEVVIINVDPEGVPLKIEIKRPSGSHNEYLADSDSSFGFVEKVN